MDNIIVNSALWYAEQSSQFLLNSGANKLLDKGYDYYVKEFIPLGHRQKQREFNAGIEPYLRIAVSAAYYLASKNAEIKEVKIPKEKRPVLVSKPGATPKKVNVKTYNVGFVIGKGFEMQLVSGAEYQKSTATGTGRTVRPHVRRAHWHHYWVGEGRTRLEVRWIEPTFVLPEGKREIKIATVRRVMGT